MADGLPGHASDRLSQPPLRIQGQKVVLREKRLEDAEDDYAWRSDPELAAFDAVAPLRTSLSDFLVIYREELRYPSPRQRSLSIEDMDGVHIGNCMYYDVSEQKGQAELGIMIGRKDYWSQGYGSDAVVTLVRHLFETTTLSRVYLHTLKWNERAQKAFQKAGFAPIGETQRNGQVFVAMEIFRRQVSLDGLEPDAEPSEAAGVAKVDTKEP